MLKQVFSDSEQRQINVIEQLNLAQFAGSFFVLGLAIGDIKNCDKLPAMIKLLNDLECHEAK